MNCPKCKTSLNKDSVKFIGAIQCDLMFTESFFKCRNCGEVVQIAHSGQTIVHHYPSENGR